MPRCKEPPRKVTIGTLMYAMWVDYPGVDARLEELSRFIDQMAHVIVRNILDDVTDPFQARAGELLFREQTATNEDGAILMGDTEVIEMLAASGGMGNLGRLVSEGGVKPKQVDLDVL